MRQLKLLNDLSIVQTADRLWPDVRLATSPEKNATIARATGLIKSGGGDPSKGRIIFMNKCGTCHHLFDAGGSSVPILQVISEAT